MLRQAITRAENGSIDADLGGNIIKQRIARQGQGKSSGFRCIIAFRSGDKAFFIYGFLKKKRSNIRKDELDEFKELAKYLLELSNEHLTALISKGQMTEVI